MDIHFLPHNSHLEDPDLFQKQDPHLKQLLNKALVYHSSLLDHLPIHTPGIYSISGGRQIGKTTLLKQWMAKLLEKNIPPRAINYFSGELIDDHHSLIRLISESLDSMPDSGLNYILLDEVTYISGWDKAVKYLADAGMLEKAVFVFTGSDMVIIKEARMRFPGRRGSSDIVDFHLYPLSFFEFVTLKDIISAEKIETLMDVDTDIPEGLIETLFETFESYMVHGGFLTAINDMMIHKRILTSTFAIYSDWIRGDVLKRNKQEHYLVEILNAIIKRFGSQVTWNALSHDLSIDHPKTIADYIALLESMGAVFVQHAIIEDKLTASPKKAKKVMFQDPFIFHAIRSWLSPVKDAYKQQVIPIISDPDCYGRLIEACVATHYDRFYPTYYIKSKVEVDIAYVQRDRFWPVEVKWTGQLRPKQLKQIIKYPNALIVTKSRDRGEIQGIPTSPLPLELFRLGPSPITIP